MSRNKPVNLSARHKRLRLINPFTEGFSFVTDIRTGRELLAHLSGIPAADTASPCPWRLTILTLKAAVEGLLRSKPSAIATFRIGSSLWAKRSTDFAAFAREYIRREGAGMFFEDPLEMPFRIATARLETVFQCQAAIRLLSVSRQNHE